jgi:hypothetical protein
VLGTCEQACRAEAVGAKLEADGELSAQVCDSAGDGFGARALTAPDGRQERSRETAEGCDLLRRARPAEQV